MRRPKWLVPGLLLAALAAPALGSVSPETLSAVVPAGTSITETKTVSVPTKPPLADVVFAFDLTGSMSGVIDTAKTRAHDILTKLSAIPGVDVQFGVMSYMDYPAYYSSCGYSASYGYAPGDYPYRLDHAVSGDTAAVEAAFTSLVQGSGGDGPQDYTRVFYESYADPSIAWRPGAKRILINFADDVPHDCNLNEGVSGTTGTWSTGCDPGRDGVQGTADDLDLQTVLAGMGEAGVVLLEAHTSEYAADHWDYWTSLTGGRRYVTASTTLVDDISTAVLDALEAPTVTDLHLQATPEYASWVSTTPASYPTVTPGTSVSFQVTISVPAGTPSGTYGFTIAAVDGVGVNYGTQQVTIVVPPEGGFVTGGGWIRSPRGAYVPDPLLTGKATFGFVAHYRSGGTDPQTQFEFHAGGMRFHGNTCEWLVLGNAGKRAQFKGEGLLNGALDANLSPFKFMVWAADGRPDAIRVRIWSESEGTQNVVYDNGGTPLGGGSIVIHK